MNTTSAPHREQSAKRNKTADSSLNINQKQSTNIRKKFCKGVSNDESIFNLKLDSAIPPYNAQLNHQVNR
jgi:hypothetical protein